MGFFNRKEKKEEEPSTEEKMDAISVLLKEAHEKDPSLSVSFICGNEDGSAALAFGDAARLHSIIFDTLSKDSSLEIVIRNVVKQLDGKFPFSNSGDFDFETDGKKTKIIDSTGTFDGLPDEVKKAITDKIKNSNPDKPKIVDLPGGMKGLALKKGQGIEDLTNDDIDRIIDEMMGESDEPEE